MFERAGAAGTVSASPRSPLSQAHSFCPVTPLHQKHNKFGGHKNARPAYVVATAVQAQQDRLRKRAHEPGRSHKVAAHNYPWYTEASARVRAPGDSLPSAPTTN